MTHIWAIFLALLLCKTQRVIVREGWEKIIKGKTGVRMTGRRKAWKCGKGSLQWFLIFYCKLFFVSFILICLITGQNSSTILKNGL